MSQGINYAPTVRARPEDASVASARRSMRYVAVLHGLMAGLFLMGALITVPVAISGPEVGAGSMLFAGAICLALGGVLAVSAVGLWTCRYRWAPILVSGVMLLGFPLGTLIGVLTLVLVLGRNGQHLFD